MSLSELLGDATKEIKYKGTGKKERIIKVYPLSLTGIGILIKESSDSFNSLLTGEIKTSELMANAPALAGRIIKIGTRDDASVDDILKLPIGLQLSILEAVWELSELDPVHLGKSIRRFTEMTGKMAKELKLELPKSKKLSANS